MSLLEHDQKLIKDLGLSADQDLGTADKLEFVDAQINGIQQQLWRSRVDAMLNHGLKASDAKEAAAVAGKIAEHEADVKRFVEALGLLRDLRDELSA